MLSDKNFFYNAFRKKEKVNFEFWVRLSSIPALVSMKLILGNSSLLVFHSEKWEEIEDLSLSNSGFENLINPNRSFKYIFFHYSYPKYQYLFHS